MHIYIYIYKYKYKQRERERRIKAQSDASTPFYVRTATHCNTLQHTATHCNTLQHTTHATHCNTRSICAGSQMRARVCMCV